MIEDTHVAKGRPRKPKLLYSIQLGQDGWTACCEDQRYGPYSTRGEAVISAVTEATAAGRLGFHSIIACEEHYQILAEPARTRVEEAQQGFARPSFARTR
jgi:hypothetical protein